MSALTNAAQVAAASAAASATSAAASAEAAAGIVSDAATAIDADLSLAIDSWFPGKVADPLDPVGAALRTEFVTPAAEKIYYVSPRGSGAQDGRSWKNAFATVKQALQAINGTTNCRIEVGVGTITETETWGTVPQGTVINGTGKLATTILHGFNGDQADMGQGVMLSNLTLNGQGATYTGRGLTFTGTRGAQRIQDCQILNFEGECLWFAYTAGSGFKLNDSLVYRYNAPSGSERYAIVIEDLEQLSAVPRKFDGLDSGGQATFSFGGSNDTFVTSSFLNDIKYSVHSAGVLVLGCRLASPKAVQEIRGSNNTIVGCDVYSEVVVKGGSGGNVIGPNAYNTLPPKDESQLNTNKLYHESYAFTPTFVTASTATTVGAMSRSGFWSRNGATITATMDFTVAADTVMGTGEIRLGLPVTRFNGDAVVVGTAIIFPAGGSTQYTALVQSVGAQNYVRLIRDTSGIVTPTSPHAAGLAAGSNIRVTVTYRL